MKLLLRSKRMTEAKADVIRILKLVKKREAAIKKFKINENQPDETMNEYNFILEMSSRIYKYINLLQGEYKILRRPFVFRNTDYQDHIILQSENIYKQITDNLGLRLDRKMNRRGQVVEADQETEDSLHQMLL